MTKKVSALQKLLMDVPFESLLSFLHRTHLDFTLTRGKKRGHEYWAEIRGEGQVSYSASSTNSARAALCDALAKLLVLHDGDFHDL